MLLNESLRKIYSVRMLIYDYSAPTHSRSTESGLVRCRREEQRDELLKVEHCTGTLYDLFFYRDDWRVGKSMSVWWPYFIIGVGKKDIIWGKPCIMHSGQNYY